MTATIRNLWDAFCNVAEARAESPALILKDRTVSFSELTTLAEKCAGWLHGRGLLRGQIIAIQLPKRLETYALWLACLRQGTPYVFMDPKNPPERTGRILGRVGPSVFFTTTDYKSGHCDTVSLPSHEAGAEWLNGLNANAHCLPARVHGLDPAYIMFTSGSTGEPKGAVIPHQGVLSLMRWGATLADLKSVRFSNINPLHFDNSVFDLFCGLMNGAALVPVETGMESNPAAWVRQLRAGGANVIFAVPTLFQTLSKLNLLKPENLPDARLFVFGGEGFPIAELRKFHSRFAGQARLLNVYGPTETSCICSSLEIDAAALDSAEGSFVSLGRMHADFDHAVLDEDGVEVEVGAIGELWIGGTNTGLGYYANPEETGRRFRQDPRQSKFRSIWYRSGDLVREDGNGLLWFQGRADNQVKVRGHRIELEEIDLVLERIDGVVRAVASVVSAADGPEIRAAFVAERKLEPVEVRAHCGKLLPSYMQPAQVVQMDSLPTNANGKVDRKAVQKMLSDTP